MGSLSISLRKRLKQFPVMWVDMNGCLFDSKLVLFNVKIESDIMVSSDNFDPNIYKPETVDGSAVTADNEIQKAQGINRLSWLISHIPARPAGSPEYFGRCAMITYI